MRVVVEKSKSGKTFGICLMDANEKPYLVVKNCKIATKADGAKFISPPSVKMDDGKWLNHAYISPSLHDQVLATLESMEQAHSAANPSQPQQNDPDFEDDVPW